MKLWEATISQVVRGTVCVWMPDDAGTVEACAEATRYARALEANGALVFDHTPDLPQVHDAFPEGSVEWEDEGNFMFNLAPEFAVDPKSA